MARPSSKRRYSSEQWSGMTLYRCQHVLPSGRVCGHDTLDFQAAEAHDREHDPKPPHNEPATTLTDRFGNPLSS